MRTKSENEIEYEQFMYEQERPQRLQRARERHEERDQARHSRGNHVPVVIMSTEKKSCLILGIVGVVIGCCGLFPALVPGLLSIRYAVSRTVA